MMLNITYVYIYIYVSLNICFLGRKQVYTEFIYAPTHTHVGITCKTETMAQHGFSLLIVPTKTQGKIHVSYYMHVSNLFSHIALPEYRTKSFHHSLNSTEIFHGCKVLHAS